jgi:hypothetical protein
VSDDELRQIVREAIERHLGRSEGAAPVGPPGRPGVAHSSHARFVLSSGADLDGPCLIEPAVPCVHCGYCQSYGH